MIERGEGEWRIVTGEWPDWLIDADCTVYQKRGPPVHAVTKPECPLAKYIEFTARHRTIEVCLRQNHVLSDASPVCHCVTTRNNTQT